MTRHPKRFFFLLIYLEITGLFIILGYIFMLRSPIRTANQLRRSYKNDEFDWPFDLVTVT